MTRERHERARELFAKTSELPEADRDAFLEEACGDDADLLEEVRGLVAFDAFPEGAVPGTVIRHAETYDEPGSELIRRLVEHRPGKSRYELQGEVARGGMGAIWRVWDSDLRRHLAMKILLGRTPDPSKGDTPAADPVSLGRFLEEAQVTGQLDHPGIVPVHELGVDSEGGVFFTMRLVKGREFREIIDLVHKGEAGWTLPKALGVLLKACEAMAYAHSKGVIHRDLKPANIMVGRFGEVYVMDWGLARVLGQEDKKDIRIRPPESTATMSVRSDRREDAGDSPDSPLYTMDGDIVGTPSYMAPEQAAGKISEVGPRSDVYSMGAILYHLLSGQVPYVPPGSRVSVHAVLGMVLHGSPPPLHELHREVLAELQAICERAMTRSSGGRYDDVGELARDLTAFLEGRVVRAYEAGAWAEMRKWIDRNRALASSILVGASLLVLTLSGSSWVLANRNEELRNARESAMASASEAARSAREAEANLVTAIAREREADRARYVAATRLAALYLEREDSIGMCEALELCAEASQQEAGTDASLIHGWERAYLDRAHDFSRALPCPELARAVAISADGGRVAAGLRDGLVRVWKAPEYEVETELAFELGVEEFWLPFEGTSAISFGTSGDSDRLYVGYGDGTVRVIELAGPVILAEARIAETPITDLAQCSADELLVVTFDGDVRRWAFREGAIESLDLEPSFQHAILGECGGVASASSDHVSLQDTSGARRAELGFPFRFGVPTDLDYHRNGRVAVSSSDGPILVWNGPSGSAQSLEHRVVTRSLRFGISGEHLFAGGVDGVIREWQWSESVDAWQLEPLASLIGHHSRHFQAVENTGVHSLELSSDGRMLISADSSERVVRVWDLDGVRPHRVHRHRGVSKSVLALTPIASVFTSSESTVEIQPFGVSSGDPDLRQPRSFVLQDGFEGVIATAAVSPSGEFLALGSDRGRVELRDFASGELQADLDAGDSAVLSLCFGGGGSLAIGEDNGVVRVFAVENRRLIAEEQFDEAVTALEFGPRLGSLTVGTQGGSVLVLETDSRVRTVRWRAPGAVRSLAYPAGSDVLAVACDSALALVRDSGARVLARWNIGYAGTYAPPVAWSPDGTRLVSGSNDATVEVWDPFGGVRLLTLTTIPNEPAYGVDPSYWSVEGVTFSPEGERIIACTKGGRLDVWDSGE